MDVNKLTGFAKSDFTCDKCGGKFYQEVAYSAARNWEEFDNNYTYCLDCVEKEEKKPKKTKDFGIPPQEASENLRSLEIDKRTLRKTGRVKQFNTSVSEKWLERLKEIAYEERLRYVEVLEKALESYENQRSNKTSNLQQTLKNIEKQVQSLQGQMSWEELELRINNLKPNLFNRVGLSITYEVLKETLQEFLRLGRKRTE